MRCTTGAGLVLLLALSACSKAPTPHTGTHIADSFYDDNRPDLVRGAVIDGTPLAPAPAPGGAAPLALRAEVGADQLVIACDRVTARLLAPLENAFEHHFEGVDLEIRVWAGRSPLRRVAEGEVDAALVIADLESQDRGRGLVGWPIADHVLALGIHPEVSLPTVSRDALRKLLTGDVRHWSWMGANAGHISLILPQPGPDAGLVAREFIPGDALTDKSMRVLDEAQVVDRLSRTPGAVGVVSLAALQRAPDTRLVAIDGLVPNLAAFRAGAYPYGATIRLVSKGNPVGDVAVLQEFFATERAKEALGDVISLRR